MNIKLMEKIFRYLFILVFVTGTASLPGRGAMAQEPAQVLGNDVLYTTDSDFDRGTLLSVNHNSPYNDQLQLDSQTKPFPFINVAASGRGTMVRTNTETGEVVGEYRTAPEGRGLNPSRTTVDLFGNVWTANRDETGSIDGVPHGSAVKIGLIVGGTRVDETGSPDPEGGYLAPPFGYNTCVDRDGDGLIRTSKGLYDILDWPDITDGLGGEDGLVQDAVDECILIYQRLYDAEQARHVSVDADNNVWVGGYPFLLRVFYKLDGASGAILDSFDARDIGCGGYGGLIDGNGILWSVGGALLRYDPATRSGFCIQQYGYGLGIDTNGYIWMSLWDGGIVKVAPDGTVEPGFPKPTFPTSTLTSALTADEMSGLMATSSQDAPAKHSSVLAAGDMSRSRLHAPGHASSIKNPAANDSAKNHRMTASSRDEMQALNDALAEDPSVTFQVAPVDDWVQSFSPWTPGATITLTITDGGVEVYSDQQTADDYGNFNFNFGGVFDLQPGQVVTVSDGTITKTHTVMNLFVDGVDMTAETIFGRADAGTDVEVWVHGNGGLNVPTDGSGVWSADFSSQTDLTYLSDGGSRQYDSDGDSTGVWWASPRFQVSPEDDWVQSSGNWTPGTVIELTIEGGGVAMYSDSQTADINGHFNFNLWNVFDLQRGQVVTVSDGTITKTHTVMPLYVDNIDVTAETISGRADSNANVDVWVHGNGGLTVTSDGGNWTADFTGQTDLTWFSDGGSQQIDGDGDATGVWWSSPRIEVSPQDDWVQSWNRWKPATTVTLTIEDGGVEVYSDSQTTDIWGNFHFGLWDIFELQRGQVVTVSDGTITKTHTVMPLYVDDVDAAADTLSGRADAGKDVEVWVNGDGWQAVTPDSSGNWTADFTGKTDLTYLSDGGSRQADDDADSTHVSWSSPRFRVAPDNDWVESWSSWTPGATVALTIADGGSVVYTDSQTATADGYFNFNLWDVFDLQRGQLVTVSDGTNTKTHTVMPLYVDGVDLTTDTISGRAVAGKDVDVWVHGDGNLTVSPDGSGNWTADFSSQTDLTYANDGGSQQLDDDGDATGVWWASPKIEVSPEDDWVQSWNRWTPETTVTLTIADGSSVVYSDSQTTDSHGNFHFSLWNIFDLQRGQVVTVSDGTTTKTHTVLPLYVDGVDITTDTISGRADASKDVEVWVNGDGWLVVAPDGPGNWSADFSSQTDLTYAHDGGSRQVDEDGDTTLVSWSSPRFQVAPEDDWVQSWSRWTPGATITLTIEDGGVEVYSDSQTADTNGYFNFNLWDVFDLQRGQVVTVSDGTTTKTHTVMPLYVDDIDITTDTISGRADASKDVDVWVHGNGGLTVTSDGGNWTADFSGMTDLTYLSDGGSQQIDEDGDATGVWWSSPSFQATPEDNTVSSWNRWSAGTTVTLTVEENGIEVQSDSQTTDAHGNFNFNVWAVDLETGHQITVTDGTLTKTHTVTDVSVTSIDTDADQVHGTAASGARVRVRVSLFNDGSERTVLADADGNWMADFSVGADGQPAYNITDSTFVNANEFDDDGDSTYRRFGAPIQGSTGVAVTPADNHVWVANRNTGTVTRLDNDGNVVKMIATGQIPTGVAVDAAGKVWATNLGSDNTVRIDPFAGSDGLGEVDLTVDLGPGSSPYNYSDMTGAVVVGSTSPQGFWTVIQDSQIPGFEWGRMVWNTEPEGNEPPGTAIVVEARAADTEAGLGGQPFQPISNGELFSMFGRFIEVRVTLKASPDGASPVLSDIRVQPHVIYVAIDIKPGSYPNSINCKNKKEEIAVAVLTTEDFDALTVDHTTVTFEGASEIHVDKRSGLPIQHIEDIDLDGDMDLVFHFNLRDTALTCGSTIGQLKGLTYDGIPVEGTDSLRMITR
jgi:hypothetical protein